MACRTRAVTLLMVSVLVTGLLIGPVDAQPRASEKSVKLSPLYFFEDFDGPAGGSSEITIHLREVGGKEFRVGFSEDEVAGTGDQWRAAGWNAATVATLLTGSPLGGNEITVDITGRIDGPSAGALMTVGILALMRGDKIKPDITMTGTINPDGTVGPVGGIPYKIDGAVSAGKKRMLIPLGLRNTEDFDGNLVDVVALGSQKGVAVSEVADIYQVYLAFTGKKLPRPEEASQVALSNRSYDRLQAFAGGWLAEYEAKVSEFLTIDPLLQAPDVFGGLMIDAEAAAARAQSLGDQGLQAGAYLQALQAAALARSAVASGRALEAYLTSGIDAFVSQIEASAAIEGKIEALLGRFRTERPTTLSEAAALIDAYSELFDTLTLQNFALQYFDQANQVATEEEAVPLLAGGAVYYEFAGTFVQAAGELLELGSSSGPKLSKDVSPKQAADFFRKAAEANFNAFDTIIVEPEATASGVSTDLVRAFFIDQDFGYALAQAGFNLVENQSLEEALGGGKNAAYGDLGGSVALYVRANSLLAKYYSLIGSGCLDETLEPVCASNERALTSALDLGQSQAGRSIGVLLDRKVDPTLQIGLYESAQLSREGGLTNKLDALDSYLSSFLESRILAYLGGFPTAGLE